MYDYRGQQGKWYNLIFGVRTLKFYSIMKGNKESKYLLSTNNLQLSQFVREPDGILTEVYLMLC